MNGLLRGSVAEELPLDGNDPVLVQVGPDGDLSGHETIRVQSVSRAGQHCCDVRLLGARNLPLIRYMMLVIT